MDIDVIKLVYISSYFIIAANLIFLVLQKQNRERLNYVFFALWSFFLAIGYTVGYFFVPGTVLLRILLPLFSIASSFFLVLLLFKNIYFHADKNCILVRKNKLLALILFVLISFIAVFLNNFLFIFFSSSFVLIAFYFFYKSRAESFSSKIRFYNFCTGCLFFFFAFFEFINGIYLKYYNPKISIYILLFQGLILMFISFLGLYSHMENIALGRKSKYYTSSRRFVVLSFLVFLIIIYFFNINIEKIKKGYYDNLDNYKEKELSLISSNFNSYKNKLALLPDFFSKKKIVIDFYDSYYKTSSSSVFLKQKTSLTSSLYKDINDFREVMGISVVYFMDKDGLVIFSSNRGEADSFLGKNYSFRPYFKESMKGSRYTYFAKGVTSGKRGAYFSAPIYSGINSEILGVVVVKMSEDTFDNFFIDKENVFLLTPSMTIFSSSEDSIIDKLIKEYSGEVGNTTKSLNIGLKDLGIEQVNNFLYYSKKEGYLALKLKDIDIDGWKIGIVSSYVGLEKIVQKEILIYFLVTIVYMLLFYFIVAYFFDVLYAQSTEDNYEDIFKNSNDLIFNVDIYGDVIFFNPAFKKIFQYKIKNNKINIKDILVGGSDEYKRILKNIETENNIKNIELVFFDNNNQKIYLQGVLTKDNLDSSMYMVRAILRNITEEKKWNIKNKETKIKLEKLLKNAQEDKKRQETQRLATLNILEDVSDTQEKLQKYNKDLKKRGQELESLALLGGEFSNVFETSVLISKVSDYLLSNTDIDGVSFFLKTGKENGEMFFQTYLGKNFSKDTINKLNITIQNKIIENAKNFSLKLSQIKRLNNKIIQKGVGKNSYKIKSQSFFDLQLAKESLGFIYVFSRKENTCSESMRSYLRTIATTFSVALVNAQLLNKTQQSKTESLVRTLSNGILMFDNKGKLLMINPAGEKFTGIDKSGQGLDEFYSNNSKYKLKELLSNALKKGKLKEIKELKIKSKNTEYIYQVLITPIYDYKKKIIGVAFVMQDITHMKYIDRMKTEFVSVASHQLRTPLTAIKLFTEMLINEQVGKISKEQREYLSNVYDSTERMVGLVNDLLNVTRIESGRLMINPEITDIDSFISSLLSEARPLAEIKNVKITYKKGVKALNIPLDRSLVRQVYHNLLTNAIRYTPEGGEVNVRIKSDKKFFIVSVSDSGIGIPVESQKRIFEKFFRADNAVKVATEGTGLGLYVSKMIIETSGGSIWFKSSPGKGTTFFVALPKKGMKKKEGERGLAIS